MYSLLNIKDARLLLEKWEYLRVIEMNYNLELKKMQKLMKLLLKKVQIKGIPLCPGNVGECMSDINGELVTSEGTVGTTFCCNDLVIAQ